jgi:hypothetical protein
VAGSPDGRQEITISTRTRLAAGLCALSVALLFGGFGEPVAVADTGTGGSVGGTHDPGGQGEDGVTTETEPTEGTEGTEGPSGTSIVGTLPELLGALGTEPHPPSGDVETHNGGETDHDPGGLTGPMAMGGSTDDQAAAPAVIADNAGTDSSPAATSQESNDPESVVSHTPESSSGTTNSDAASLTNAEVSSLTNGEVNSVTDADVNPPAGNPPAEEPTAVQPVTSAVASVDTPASSVPPPTTPPVVGAAQSNDVIKALAYFFIALTNDGVPYIKIPNDLLSFLGLPLMGDGATASSAAGAVGGSLFAGGGLYTAAPTQVARAVQAGWPGMLIAPGDPGALSSAGVVVHPTPGGVGTSGAAEEHPVGLKAVLAGGLVPEQLRSVIQHTVDAVLAPLSLLALAALASPGAAGLVLFSSAGMFVGYRQARAASMLRAPGIARFVKAGPLGIVRSGGLVAVHSRPSASAGRQPTPSHDLLESVA